MKMTCISRLAVAATFIVGAAACGSSSDAPAEGEAEVWVPSADELSSPEDEVRYVRAENAADEASSDQSSEQADDGNSMAAAGAAEAAEAADVKARGFTEIGWEDLMPEGEEEKLAEMYQAQMARLYSGGGVAEGSAADQAIQIGTFNTVDEINGEMANGMKVRLPGYTVPFDYRRNAEITEFLLVPYYGACLHAPPPPPNQTVFVTTEEPIKLQDLSQAVWIEGVLKTENQSTDLADTAYTIVMTGWAEYDW